MHVSPKVILRGLALSAALASSAAIAQPGHGYPPPGHGGVPPGQAKKWDRPDWRFRGDERDRFRGYYANDVRRWERNRRRPRFYAGYAIPRSYRVQPVPPAYYNGLQPPPPGYQYGYYDGYVVAYNPTTRIIADVMDLVGAIATNR